MSNNNLVTLEQDVSFSQSLLWKYQKDYFAQKGINAWANSSVPFYVTSNMVIAYSYAQMALRFIQDNLANGTIDPKQPIYLFELATGSGKLSYLFLHLFKQFLQQLRLDYLDFHYVMTDFTTNNLQYWQSHECLKPFAASGMLDFAIFDIGTMQNITLINSKVVLDTNSCKNPIIVIANYTFDTVNHDLFRIAGGNLEAGYITTKTTQDNIIPDGIQDLERLQTDFTFQPIKLPFYQDNNLNAILDYYHKNLNDTTFLVPLGAIAAVDNLARIANNRLLLLSCDKGFTSIDALKNLSKPHIAFHGSFSMMVNFDFLGRYMEQLGGDTALAEDYEGTKVSVFCLGFKFNQLPNTTWAIDQFNTHFATNEFLLIKNFLIRDTSKLDMEHILALLKFSYWDTDIFFSVASRIAEIITKSSPGQIKAMHLGLKTLDDHFYFVRNYKNIPFEIGHIYQVLNDLEAAIKFYQKAIDLYGEESSTYFNMGLCRYHKHDVSIALECFEKAYALNSNNASAKEWIDHINKSKK